MYPGTHAAVTPDRPAIIMAGSGETMTFGELDRASARLSRYLVAQGLLPGDVVAILATNSPRFMEVFWATQRCGLYALPINTHLTAEEIRHIIAHSGARALIVSGSKAEAAAQLTEGLPAVELRMIYGAAVDGFLDYDTVLADVPTTPLRHQPRGADMLYSSGTTGGRPKGIKQFLPEREVHEPGDAMVDAFAPRYGFDADAVYLSPAPLYHGGPLRFAVLALAVGSTIVVLERFDAEACLAAIERFGVTHSQWVPTMFVRMLKLPEEVRNRYDLSSHRVAIHASAPCPVDVKHAMIAWWGPILEEFYSPQEAAGITFISCEEWLSHPGSVGRPGVGEIRICDEDGQVLPPGEVGTVYFARDELPFEYHGDPELTREAQHPQHPGWSTPGDLGYVDEEGYLYLTDRRAFMIISGGVNIFPQEAEDVLILHPAVHDVAVIGVPDDDLGEKVKAVVEVAPGYAPSPELERELLDHVLERLAKYKAPRSIDFATELPRTPTGKLVKGKLVEQYRQAAAAAGAAQPGGE